MKRLIKALYTRLFNFKLFFLNKRIKKGVFIGRRTEVKNRKYLYIGKNARIGNGFIARFYDNFEGVKYEPSVIIEEDAYIGDNFKILSNDKVKICKNALLASDIFITTENHGMDPECGIKYGKQTLTNKPVELGENCWIGEKVVILPGVTVGKYSIVAAGSVVTRSVEDYTIVAGNPARVIKKYNFETKTWEKA